jgi:CBS domain-containing protein
LAAGLPTVRPGPGERRALDDADREPSTCAPATPVSELAGPALVVGPGGVVLGRVQPDGHPPDVPAEDVMTPGPATVRANEPLDEFLRRMERRNVAEIIVTTPEGRLLGVVRTA